MAWSWSSSIANPRNWGSFLGAYDGVAPQGKRRQAAVTNLGEDQLLNQWDRSQLGENAVDLLRNFAIVQWMVNQHLNYVARFTFQGSTDNQDFNRALETRIAEHSKKGNCDVTGQESFRSFVRNIERQRCLTGDFLTVLLDIDGDPLGKLQGIEFDRLRSPNGDDNFQPDTFRQWIQGVRVDRLGRHLQYAVHRRVNGEFKLDTLVDARNACFAAYKQRTDQVRGVGLITSALNYLRDVHENLAANLMKAKVQALFALAFETQFDPSGEGTAVPDKRDPYKVNFGNGPLLLQMYPGDKAQFLTTKASDKEFREFMTLTIMLTLKSLDLPMSMLDESHTNYSGHKGAWLHYETSCIEKRETLREVCDRITLFWIAKDLQSGALKLPRGMKAEEISWQWIPPAMPWWKPTEEIYGELAAVSAGITTLDEVCKRRGTGDIYSNITKNAAILQWAKDKGFELVLASPGATQGAKSQDPDESGSQKQAA